MIATEYHPQTSLTHTNYVWRITKAQYAFAFLGDTGTVNCSYGNGKQYVQNPSPFFVSRRHTPASLLLQTKERQKGSKIISGKTIWGVLLLK